MTPPLPEEILSRFLLASRWFNSVQGRVKAEAFMPHPHFELSVFRTGNLPEEAVWTIGDSIARPLAKTLYGRAEVTVEAVLAVKLNVIVDEPPPLHANITGWPAEKSAQKLLALELAARAKFVPKNGVGQPDM